MKWSMIVTGAVGLFGYASGHAVCYFVHYRPAVRRLRRLERAYQEELLRP